MARIIFYEKPGCINNTKQKRILSDAGHEVEARNLLEENWTKESLGKFFKSYLVSEWFNMTAPLIKEGSIVPTEMTADEAVEAMIEHPILIRRPLMEVNGRYILGFNVDELNSVTKETTECDDPNIEKCARTA